LVSRVYLNTNPLNEEVDFFTRILFFFFCLQVRKKSWMLGLFSRPENRPGHYLAPQSFTSRSINDCRMSLGIHATFNPQHRKRGEYMSSIGPKKKLAEKRNRGRILQRWSWQRSTEGLLSGARGRTIFYRKMNSQKELNWMVARRHLRIVETQRRMICLTYTQWIERSQICGTSKDLPKLGNKQWADF